MTLKHRRLLASFFIIIFLVAAPLLVAYTAGFRFNFKKWSWQKTGSISIETEPKKTMIFLDGKLMKASAPAIINSLFPGVYKIRLEKDGYIPWEQDIEVTAQNTSFLKNLVLIPKIIERTRSKIFSKNDSPVSKKSNDSFVFDNDQWTLRTETAPQKKLTIGQIPDEALNIFQTDEKSFAIFKIKNNGLLIGSIIDGLFSQKDKINDVADMTWDEKSLTLTVAAGLELTQYDFQKEPIKKTLITRSSRDIDRILPFLDFPHIMAAQGEQLNAIEQTTAGVKIIPIFTLRPDERIIAWEFDKKLRLSVWAQDKNDLEYFELALTK